VFCLEGGLVGLPVQSKKLYQAASWLIQRRELVLKLKSALLSDSIIPLALKHVVTVTGTKQFHFTTVCHPSSETMFEIVQYPMRFWMYYLSAQVLVYIQLSHTPHIASMPVEY